MVIQAYAPTSNAEKAEVEWFCEDLQDILEHAKKDECRRINAFELWCWRRLLRVSWIASRFSPSILKEISPEYSLEELMLKLQLQYFGHLM